MKNVSAFGLMKRAQGEVAVMNGEDKDEEGNYFKVGAPERHEVDKFGYEMMWINCDRGGWEKERDELVKTH